MVPHGYHLSDVFLEMIGYKFFRFTHVRVVVTDIIKCDIHMIFREVMGVIIMFEII